MDLMLNGGAKGASAGKYVKDSDSRSFMQDVIETSMEVPVLVDFWATWCEPCKTLGPLLEKLVNAAGGAIRLVKVDVDKNQQLAAQIRVQSVPTVYAFKDGRPVDGFVGVVPESQIKQLIARLTAGAAQAPGLEEALAEAKTLLDEGATEEAAALYQQIVQHDPANAAAQAGLARSLIELGETVKATRLLAALPPELAKSPEIAAVQTSLALAEEARKAGPVGELRRKLAAAPDDHQTRLDLALACFAAGEQQAAIDELLELFRRDREWNDGAARKQLVKLFEALGPGNALATAGRRRLSSLMFS